MICRLLFCLYIGAMSLLLSSCRSEYERNRLKQAPDAKIVVNDVGGTYFGLIGLFVGRSWKDAEELATKECSKLGHTKYEFVEMDTTRPMFDPDIYKAKQHYNVWCLK